MGFFLFIVLVFSFSLCLLYVFLNDYSHRVGRVLSFFSSRRNWDSPTPLAAGECAPPPPFGPGGREHSPAAKGVGESQFRRVTYTVVLYVYKYFVIIPM
jgi:hypothetical protein